MKYRRADRFQSSDQGEYYHVESHVASCGMPTMTDKTYD